MKILFIHPNFAGQFFYLAQYLAQDEANEVYFLAEKNSIRVNLAGVKLGIYKQPSEEALKKSPPRQRPLQLGVLRGEAIVRALHFLRKENGFVPDIIIGHTGFGSLLFVKDYYPEVPLLGYFEWYYNAFRGDGCWWPEEETSLGEKMYIRLRNVLPLLSLEACDKGLTPTNWQLATFPEEFRSKLSVIHEGIDTDFCSPLPVRPGLELKTEEIELSLPAGSEIVTYVSRGFEPYRGFPQFMEAMRIVLSRRPKCHAVLVGSDYVAYGQERKGPTYKEEEEQKGGYDRSRVHFTGHLMRGDYQRVLRASCCHVYLTRPFVLSWSFLEAMSFGLPMVASATPPCEEVVTDGVNGLLADFRSPQEIADRIIELLEDREKAERLGKAARETVLERYEVMSCLRKQKALIDSMLERK